MVSKCLCSFLLNLIPGLVSHSSPEGDLVSREFSYMKVTMTFIAPEKLERLNEIQRAKYEFEHLEKSSHEKPKRK
ncbi:MAG: hypothetical protein P1P72_09565 [ANME-2 cluster archaeon]|nr:hypothetical protein [ANME-2 cluster archaeon]